MNDPIPEVKILPRVIAGASLRQVPPDGGESVEVKYVNFDATDYILGLNIEQLCLIKDGEWSADSIAIESFCQDVVNHPGPFAVNVEKAIADFLVSHGLALRREEVSAMQWCAIREKYADGKITPHRVEVVETLTRRRTLVVDALSYDEAKLKALDKANQEPPTEGWARLVSIDPWK